MSIRSVALTVLCAAGVSLAVAPAFAGESEWHFKVSNDTKSRITKLQTSADKKEWGDFDIGDGIKPGVTETMIWDDSTDGEDCDQWIRAKFADGTSSEPSKVNFCEDLDEPIVFSE